MQGQTKCEKVKRFIRKLFRLHKIQGDPVEQDTGDETSQLKKCLTTIDLISLGAGSCVGTGMFVVAGMVAKEVAGPGVIFSFIIAATASILSGACYAEFGVRVPNTSGSAYMYSYVTVGEFIAFFIGWNMVLEYLIGTAACAAALSATFDSLSKKEITTIISEDLGTIPVIGAPPDIVAFCICLIMTGVLTIGVKKSVLLNNLLNTISLTIFIFICGAGFFYADFKTNWLSVGFLPNGWKGVFSGAAICFYAFIGFDIIATTGEEANNPTKSIPIAIILSMFIAMFAYVVSSIILTSVVPYYAISDEAPLMEMFAAHGAYTAKYIVAAGAIAALTVSMLGSMFPMPRVVYAMAKDGVLFRKLAHVPQLTKTPALATCIFGVLSAIVALLIPLEKLVEMMSVGTLLAYSLVSSCVLILRYQPKRGKIHLLPKMSIDIRHPSLSRSDTEFTEDFNDTPNSTGRDDAFLIPDAPSPHYGSLQGGSDESLRLGSLKKNIKMLYYKCYNWKYQGEPNNETGKTVTILVCVLLAFIVLFNIVVIDGVQSRHGDNPGIILLAVISIIGIIGTTLQISRYPQNRRKLKFLAPCVPLLPTAAVLINTYLLFKLSLLTLLRIVVWGIIGLPIYFGYGINNSTIALRQKEKEEAELEQAKLEAMNGNYNGLVKDSNYSKRTTDTIPEEDFTMSADGLNNQK